MMNEEKLSMSRNSDKDIYSENYEKVNTYEQVENYKFFSTPGLTHSVINVGYPFKEEKVSVTYNIEIENKRIQNYIANYGKEKQDTSN
ncbi:MAG: hypothetical protein C4541_06920 [Candidatus Auribacter fodinae]|uniref:Uncharacterized protein n=1 Tax=Candidatus Auribacter fodinae TaxID=2093366 RepID=A0A3A4R335_9BACT|nr:MAG: hypothetical protein C4541_06920 [Candidatus Auribacter fodinae]